MSRSFGTALVAAALLAGGCLDAEDGATAPAPVIHTQSAGMNGIYVNAYLVETEHGVVAVDAMLTVSDAIALRQKLDGLGKPLLAVLLTHGHPDHYNGVTELVRGLDAPILATAAVDQVIRRDDEAKAAQWTPVFGEEWPAARTFPSRIVASGETVTLDDVSFQVEDLGPGESHADSIWVIKADPPIAFIGDAAFNGTHSYLSDGHSGEWLGNLDTLEQELGPDTVVYPGHGEQGTVELLDPQRAYLHLYRDTVRSLSDGESLTPEAKESLTGVMKGHLPTDKLEFLIPLGADPVAAELAREAE
ncbi:MBL fold metallo-hydrolase [Sorangium sp. So ce693]|uniref:MBL fold metallo-hydrolase n=1 Tax=Sorangium sp. So ce693 TaxID=3133318 RepID=UPI003F636BE0